MTQSLILATGATGTVETEMIGHWVKTGHHVPRPGARPREGDEALVVGDRSRKSETGIRQRG
jgi:hypothetical protein